MTVAATEMAAAFAVACAAAVRQAPPDSQDEAARMLAAQMRRATVDQGSPFTGDEVLQIWDVATRLLNDGLDLAASWRGTSTPTTS